MGEDGLGDGVIKAFAEGTRIEAIVDDDILTGEAVGETRWTDLSFIARVDERLNEIEAIIVLGLKIRDKLDPRAKRPASYIQEYVLGAKPLRHKEAQLERSDFFP